MTKIAVRFTLFLVGVAIIGIGVVKVWDVVGPKVGAFVPHWNECTAKAGTYTANIDPEQAENAAVIAAVADRMNLPAHAATIALATALQESKLVNLPEGDRDSVGLFQQRPSQGWGTAEQIIDPVYASTKFYEALVKVPDYQDLSITKAAQDVQHSAYPDGYAKHEDRARALASTLTGETPHGFTCTFAPPKPGTGTPGALVADLQSSLQLNSQATGDTITIEVADAQSGWLLAHFAVAHAKTDGISTIAFAGYDWKAGWDARWKAVPATPSGSPSTSGAPATTVTITFA